MKRAESTIRRDKQVIVFEHGLGGSEYYGTRPEGVFSFLCDTCGLHISLLSDFLLRKESLDPIAFCEQFYKGKTINSLPTSRHAGTNSCNCCWYDGRGFRRGPQSREISGSANCAHW
jgi:hypothetical protein